MKTIEQITLRTGRFTSSEDIRVLRQVVLTAAENLREGTVELYKHETITGDFAYFLQWKEGTTQADGSSLSVMIRKTLESFGIVNFATWTLIE
jgi:hypothetical protein